MENRKDSDNYFPESQSIWPGHWEEVGVSGKKYFLEILFTRLDFQEI